MIMKPSEFLRRHEWTQGAQARAKNGYWITVYSSNAVAFCAAGAIARCASSREENYAMRHALDDYLQNNNLAVGEEIETWNDRRGQTKENVISVLEAAGL